jgi:hypothetical protein
VVTKQPNPVTRDPGRTDTGFYTFANGIVTLTDELGEPLPGGWNAELAPDDAPLPAAKRLLRECLSSKRSSFSEPLDYPPRSIV